MLRLTGIFNFSDSETFFVLVIVVYLLEYSNSVNLEEIGSS